jgi:hypothetical protein
MRKNNDNKTKTIILTATCQPVATVYFKPSAILQKERPQAAQLKPPQA